MLLESKKNLSDQGNSKLVVLTSGRPAFQHGDLSADFRELTGIITSKPITNERLLERLEQEHVKVIYTE